ncbi:MAG: hypothetical protein AAFU33_20800 [Bacteroidota bacterium]
MHQQFLSAGKISLLLAPFAGQLPLKSLFQHRLSVHFQLLLGRIQIRDPIVQLTKKLLDL